MNCNIDEQEGLYPKIIDESNIIYGINNIVPLLLKDRDLGTSPFDVCSAL